MTSASGTCAGGILNLPLSIMAPAQQATHWKAAMPAKTWVSSLNVSLDLCKVQLCHVAAASARWHVLEVCVSEFMVGHLWGLHGDAVQSPMIRERCG